MQSELRNTRSKLITKKELSEALSEMKDLCERFAVIVDSMPARRRREMLAVYSIDVARNRFRSFVETNEKWEIAENGKT